MKTNNEIDKSRIEDKMVYFICANCQTAFKSYMGEVLRCSTLNGTVESANYRMRCPSCGTVCESMTREQYLSKMQNVYKINTVSNLIEMLTNIKDQISEDVEVGFDAELEVTLDVALNYLQSMIDDKPVKTNNFKLTYTFNGYKFYDVVNATDEQTAFEYLCWICNDNDDHHFVSAEICDELPSYWCPGGWVKPEPVHVARYRSLMQSLEVAGITQHDYYTPELDKVMLSLGYTANHILVHDDVFDRWDCTYIEYTRQDHYTLRVEIKEEN